MVDSRSRKISGPSEALARGQAIALVDRHVGEVAHVGAENSPPRDRLHRPFARPGQIEAAGTAGGPANQTPGDDFRFRFGHHVARDCAIAGFKGAFEFAHPALVDDGEWQVHGNGIALAGVAHFEPQAPLELARRGTGAGRFLDAVAVHRSQNGCRLVPVGRLQKRHLRPRAFDPGRRHKQAEAGAGTGGNAAKHTSDADPVRHFDRVHRPGTAGRDHGQTARIDAFFGNMHPGRHGHVLVDQIENAGDQRRRRHIKVVSQLLERRFGPRGLQPHLTAKKILRIEIAEQQIRIGHRGRAAAQAVTGRARIRPGTARGPH